MAKMAKIPGNIGKYNYPDVTPNCDTETLSSD
jgi:hypothetical protein